MPRAMSRWDLGYGKAQTASVFSISIIFQFSWNFISKSLNWMQIKSGRFILPVPHPNAKMHAKDSERESPWLCSVSAIIVQPKLFIPDE